MSLTFKRGARGFTEAEFEDRYHHVCSIQKSSLATEHAIWLGVNNANPQIMARDAFRLNRYDLLAPEGTPERLNGWVPFPVPDEVFMTTRMHLTQQQVRDLLPALIHFAETGELPRPTDDEPTNR